MSNLLHETLADMESMGHTPADVAYIGNLAEEGRRSCTWDQFVVLADVEYDCSFGAAEVAQDLVIMFSNGDRMERAEYDGSEWWERIRPLSPPPTPGEPITTLVGQYWPSLADLHDPEDSHHKAAR